MKIGTQATNPLRMLSCATLSLVMVISCTKKRPAAWPDGEADNVYEISSVEAQSPNVTLSSEQSVATASLSEMAALGEGSRLKVESASADEKFRPLFSDLFLAGQAGSLQQLRFRVGTKFVVANRVLTESEAAQLPKLERNLLRREGEDFLLPVFQTEIKEMGIVERTKNETGEETKTLRIKSTARAQATHIKFSTLVKDRKLIGVSPAGLKNAKEIFLLDKIDGQVLTNEQLFEQLNVKRVRAGSYLTKIERTNQDQILRLFAIRQLGDLSPKLQAQIRAGQKLLTAMRCDQVLQAEFGKDCVLELAYDFHGVDLIRAELTPVDSDGNIAEEVAFEIVKGQNGKADLVRIPADGSRRDYQEDKLDNLDQFDPASILHKKLLAGQEFLMRRVMQDSPNTFDFTFAGTSGPLEIVKFEFEKGRVRVVRADAVLRADGSTAVDRETLMVVPATYRKLEKTDGQGNPSQVGRLIDAEASDPEAIAFVDWTANSIPTVSSPLDFYETERCFDAVGERFVSEVDQRLEGQGILNFTLTSTYSGTRGSFDCAGISDAGYFDTVQKNFTFKERISFKKHIVEEGVVEAPELNMPLVAQKKLGFGLFTYIRKKASQNNVPGIDGTEDYLPSVFDIKKGKKITYVLAGLPTGSDARSKDIRAKITASTRKVISDLNVAFRKALKGTAMQRSEDVIELLVEGEDASTGTLGDLDRNYIYYIDKATSSGVIGLGGSHANPRSGKVESASVYLYGGNMLAMVESLRRLDQSRVEYEEGMAGKFVPAEETESGVEGESSPETAPVAPSSIQIGGGGAVGTKLAAKIGRVGTDLKKIAHVRGDMRQEIVSRLPKVSAKTEKALNALEAVIAKQEFRDAGKIARIILAREARDHEHAKDLLSPMGRMQAAGLCVMEKDLAGIMANSKAGDYDIAKKSDTQILADIWAPTLAHEIGHNLGLRHNFIASFDVANHKFNEKEESGRDYSSVMDYLNDDHFTYDGMGPQDVMALRAAYAGSLELNDGRLVKIETLKKGLGLQSWLDLSNEDVAQLPLKKFLFCSDEEAGQTPTCNRFDTGTTPEKIVDFHVQAYRHAYSRQNFPNGRIVFGPQNTSDYIGRLFTRFFAVRQMMEETILLASQQRDYSAYLPAAFKGLYFLNQVLRTPDLPITVTNRLERFVPIEGDDGKVQIAEAKYLKDIAHDDTGERLRARGVEFDKVIALITLTTRDNSAQRYNDAEIQFSYGDLGGDTSPLSTQGVLKEILSNNLMPLSQAVDESNPIDDENAARFVQVSGRFRAEVTDLMRVYGVIGSVLNLDASSSANPSANFRVLSHFEVKEGMPFVQTPGAPNDLKYYAQPEAKHARSVVERGHLLQQVEAKKAELTAPLAQWIVLTLKANKTAEETAALATLQTSLNAVLATLPQAAGAKDLAAVAPLVAQLNTIGQQFAPLRPAEGQTNPLYTSLTDSVLMQVEGILRQDSVVALISEVVSEVAGDAANPLRAAMVDLKDVFGSRTLSGDITALVRNSQLLNQMLISSHPEYRR